MYMLRWFYIIIYYQRNSLTEPINWKRLSFFVLVNMLCLEETVTLLNTIQKAPTIASRV